MTVLRIAPSRWAAVFHAAALFSVPVPLTGNEQDSAGQGLQPGNHVFWRVIKPGGGELYFLGSLHFGDRRLYPLPRVIEQAFDDCDRVIFETNLSGSANGAVAALMMQAAMAEAGHTMPDTVSDKTSEAFFAAVQKLGLEPQVYQSYRTWYCANSLMTTALRRVGVFPGMGIDRTLFSRALEEGKSVEAFETPEFQIDLFAGLPDHEAEELLVQALEEIAHTEIFVEQMISAYTEGDLGALQELVTDGFNERPVLKKRFFTDRNRAWMNSIRECLAEPGVDLVVVGAGHLIGKGGLVDRCRKAGWQVTRL